MGGFPASQEKNIWEVVKEVDRQLIMEIFEHDLAVVHRLPTRKGDPLIIS